MDDSVAQFCGFVVTLKEEAFAFVVNAALLTTFRNVLYVYVENARASSMKLLLVYGNLNSSAL